MTLNRDSRFTEVNPPEGSPGRQNGPEDIAPETEERFPLKSPKSFGKSSRIAEVKQDRSQ
jgi:hypothetical protein